MLWGGLNGCDICLVECWHGRHVVSVSIHWGGADGLRVESLGGAYVVWSMLQIYYLARGRQFVSAYALSMVSVTKIHMYGWVIARKVGDDICGEWVNHRFICSPDSNMYMFKGYALVCHCLK